MPLPPLQPDDVWARLSYARVRADDLLDLNRGELLGADSQERQRLTQEVFFHLVGAIEVFAQLVNERRSLRIASEKVSIGRISPVLEANDARDPLIPHVAGLYSYTADPAPTSDPYSGNGLMYRIWNYRHQVTHRRANPFLMKIGLTATVRLAGRGAWHTSLLHGLQRSSPAPDRSGHFLLDPRAADPQASDLTVHIEIDNMYVLVQTRLEAALTAL